MKYIFIALHFLCLFGVVLGEERGTQYDNSNLSTIPDIITIDSIIEFSSGRIFWAKIVEGDNSKIIKKHMMISVEGVKTPPLPSMTQEGIIRFKKSRAFTKKILSEAKLIEVTNFKIISSKHIKGKVLVDKESLAEKLIESGNATKPIRKNPEHDKKKKALEIPEKFNDFIFESNENLTGCWKLKEHKIFDDKHWKIKSTKNGNFKCEFKSNGIWHLKTDITISPGEFPEKTYTHDYFANYFINEDSLHFLNEKQSKTGPPFFLSTEYVLSENTLTLTFIKSVSFDGLTYSGDRNFKPNKLEYIRQNCLDD